MTRKAEDPDVRKVRSEREVMRFYWMRVFPYIASIPTILFVLVWLLTDLDPDETIAVISILMVSLLFPILYKLDEIRTSSFQLDSVSFDENSMSISHKKNSWNRHTWVLEIPFEEIAILRYNKEQYEVVRQDGSIVQLPSTGSVRDRYHQIGERLAAFIEAETGEVVPLRPKDTRSDRRLLGFDTDRNPKSDHAGRLAILDLCLIFAVFTAVGFFIGGLIVVETLIHGTLLLSDTLCVLVPGLIVVLLLWKCRSLIAETHSAREEHGDLLVKAYLTQHSILVSRPNLAPKRTTTPTVTTTT